MGDSDLAFAGLVRQAELVRAGEVSPRELVELCLERIGRLDPELNAFRRVFAERALTEARQAEARRKAGDERPLLGVPVAIKDEVDVAGDVTAQGTGAYGHPAEADALVVQRLRAAGAIVIGRTHTPELCMWPFTESATWGTTRNPWDPDRTPGGSSGGSAAAVAAGLVGAALATDGAGSIRIPAACCHLFGLKPQRGRVSLMPLAEHWHHMTTYGTVTRSVADTALFLDVTAGPAPGDADRPPPPPEPFAAAARRAPGRLRIALSLKAPLPQPIAAPMRRAVERTADVLRSLGHEVVEHDPAYHPSMPVNITVRYLASVAREAGQMPRPRLLERRTRSMARLGGLLPDRALRWSLADERQIVARLAPTFERFHALLTPVLSCSPVVVRRWEGRGALATLSGSARFVPFCPLWNLTGQPAAALPAGFTPDGVPLSVQLVGRHNDEGTLLSLAAQLESEMGWTDHRPPLAA